MTAFIVTCVIAGLMGSAFHEPSKPTRATRAQRPVAPAMPAFRPVAWAPAPPPPPAPHHMGGHLIPTRFWN